MDAATADKQAARWRCRRLRRIGAMFRCVEVLAAASLLLSWSSSHLSVDLLRRLAAALLGPRFVFLLANAIVLLLLAESGRLSPSPAPEGGGTALYEEFLEIRRRISDSLPAPPPEEIVFEDKAVCVETRAALRRSRSERAARRRKALPELQRAETDVGRKKGEGEEDDAEEFRRMIEGFIARQAKFHREESMKAIVSGAEGTCALVYCAGSPERSILK